jgi:hypothetical protein
MTERGLGRSDLAAVPEMAAPGAVEETTMTQRGTPQVVGEHGTSEVLLESSGDGVHAHSSQKEKA